MRRSVFSSLFFAVLTSLSVTAIAAPSPQLGKRSINPTSRWVCVRPTHLPDPDAKGDGVHLI